MTLPAPTELSSSTRVWFGSDHHFGHTNIIRYCNRPFVDVPHMNEFMLELHNEVVGPNDIYIHLGDLLLTQRWLETASLMQGRKLILPGNHDLCWPYHRDQVKVRRGRHKYEEAGFTVLAPEVVFKDMESGLVFLASHLPYRGDSKAQDRYREFRPKDEGLVQVCGHVHDAWRTQGRMFNVGVDVNGFAPLAVGDIAIWADGV